MVSSPSEGVDRHAVRFGVSCTHYESCQTIDVLGCLSSSENEVHLLLLRAVSAVIHQHHASEGALDLHKLASAPNLPR